MGIMDQQIVWRCVQVGYCFGQSFDDRDIVDDYEDKLVDIICKKVIIVIKIYCMSCVWIGKRKLLFWFFVFFLSFKDDDGWKDEFFDVLVDFKLWVCRGDSSKSFLMWELGWKGRMFGVFIYVEIELFWNWIDFFRLYGKDMGEVYWGCVGGYQSLEKIFDFLCYDVVVSYLIFFVMRIWLLCEMNDFELKLLIQIYKLVVEIDVLLLLWFVYVGFLENIISFFYQIIIFLVFNCL